MPNSRREFEHNMHMFSERLERDEIQIAETNVRTIKGIMRARYAPNRRVNLHTVDEMARLTANMTANMMQHKDFQKEEK